MSPSGESLGGAGQLAQTARLAHTLPGRAPRDPALLAQPAGGACVTLGDPALVAVEGSRRRENSASRRSMAQRIWRMSSPRQVVGTSCRSSRNQVQVLLAEPVDLRSHYSLILTRRRTQGKCAGAILSLDVSQTLPC
jgi:hypothetical protein